MFNNIPEQFIVNAQVLMGQDISSGGDLTPRNIRVALRKSVSTYILDCLPDDFEVACDGVPRFSVLKKPFLAWLNVFLDPSYAVEDMT